MVKLFSHVLFGLFLSLLVCGQAEAQVSQAVQQELNALKQAEARKDKAAIAASTGNIGRIYLDLAKEVSKSDDRRKVYLGQAIEYSNWSIKAAGEAGDIDAMKSGYKTLSAAQKLEGHMGEALESYRKMMGLKHNSKKALQIEKKQIEYQHNQKEDSMLAAKKLTEQRLEMQKQLASQNGQRADSLLSAKKITDQHLETETRKLTEKQKEVEIINQTLQIAEEQKALQAANLALQQSKLQLQKSEMERMNRDIVQQQRQRYALFAGIAGLLVIIVLAVRSTYVQKKLNRELAKEKKRSEDLLLNILPVEVAEELKETGAASAKHFNDVTVLFTDFVSFTSVAESMSPEVLVGELHVCFKEFDNILSKYPIEKIKTVGDAYMAVSGLPLANPDHAADVVRAAVEIRDFMLRRQAERGVRTFGIRIGINTGNVVAGIVGVRKFSYDIWGDTVNIAARMEQNSEEGKINVSASTYALVKDKFGCIYRGKIEAKNKGSIDMYYIV